MARLRVVLGRFLDSERGTSAIELAFVLPVLILLMLAGFQLVLYLNASRQIERVADSISEMISQATPTTTGSTTATVSALDIHFTYDSAMVIFPYVLKDAKQKGVSWWQNITINYASVQFTQLTKTCGSNADQSACYVANVVWTGAGAAGNGARPCTVPQIAADDNAMPSNTTLPRSLYGPGSIIAIDVTFTFVPTFGARFLPPLSIKRSAFVQPRYAALIKFDSTNNDGIAIACPGF